jgi:putative membrane protein
LSWQPPLSALLNLSSAICVVVGFTLILKKHELAHKRVMLTATAFSTLFLANYLTYHVIHGHTRYTGVGVIRMMYFSVLISHTLLATILVPLVGMTLFSGLRSRFERHKKIAWYTLPVWIYVSLSGVVIYLLLYA